MRDSFRYINIRSVTPSRYSILFGPGVFFLLIGLAVLFAPRLVLAVVAAFFLFVGVMSLYLAWRFIEVKRNFTKTFNDLKSRVSIQTLQVVDPQIEEQLRSEIERVRVDKKIILH